MATFVATCMKGQLVKSPGLVTVVPLRQHAAARQPGGIVTCPENEQRCGDFVAGQVHLNTDLRVGLASQPKKRDMLFATRAVKTHSSPWPFVCYKPTNTEFLRFMVLQGPHKGQCPDIWAGMQQATSHIHVHVEVSNYLICATWALRWFELNRQRYATCHHLSSLSRGNVRLQGMVHPSRAHHRKSMR